MLSTENSGLHCSKPCETLQTEGSVLSGENDESDTQTDAPFRDVFHALSYYNHHNPTRLKSINLAERDKRQSRGSYTNEQLWSMVCAALWFALRPYEKSVKGKAFARWYLIPRESRTDLDSAAVAQSLGVSERMFFYYLKETRQAVEERLWLDELIQDKSQ